MENDGPVVGPDARTAKCTMLKLDNRDREPESANFRRPVIQALLGGCSRTRKPLLTLRQAQLLPSYIHNTEAVPFGIGENHVVRIRRALAPMDFRCTQSYRPPHFVRLLVRVQV
jgi:hypothetical protein